jgi:hypothetical protein
MIDTFGIPLAFVIIAALTLWIVIGSKGWWWLKALVVAGAVLFSITLWHSLSALQGWPTNEELPEKFEIKWLVVEEPNKKTGFEGAIYVWAKDLSPKEERNDGVLILHSKKKSDEPRLYIMPYSRKMHEQAEGIKKQIASGKPFYGEMLKGKGKGEGKGKGKGEGKGKGKGKGPKGEGKGEGQGDGDLSNEQDPIFHELPPAVLPEKVTN